MALSTWASRGLWYSQDFLEDSAYMNDNLRLAMEDNVEGMRFLLLRFSSRVPFKLNNADGN